MQISDFSGDSSVKCLSYDGKTLSFIFEDYELDKNYQISIDTKTLYSEKPSEIGSILINLMLLQDKLEIEPKSGLYVMPKDFTSQMKAIRQGYHTALGLNSKKFKYLLVVSGYNILCACPITSEDDIKIEEA